MDNTPSNLCKRSKMCENSEASAFLVSTTGDAWDGAEDAEAGTGLSSSAPYREHLTPRVLQLEQGCSRLHLSLRKRQRWHETGRPFFPLVSPDFPALAPAFGMTSPDLMAVDWGERFSYVG